jgi:hypothetical protein
MINRIDYKALGCEVSRFDSIFLSLSSEFKNLQELKEAEDLIQANIDEFAKTYSCFSIPGIGVSDGQSKKRDSHFQTGNR